MNNKLSVKVALRFPSNNELKAQMQQVQQYLEKNARLDLKLDTASFKKSLSEMSNALQSLKDKLSKFNILDNMQLDDAKVGKTRQEVDRLAEAMGKLNEKSQLRRGSDDSKWQVKQAEAMNKAMDDQYKTEQKLANERQKYASDYENFWLKALKSRELAEQQANQKAQDGINKLQSSLQQKLNTASSNALINPSVIANLQTQLNSINTNTAEKELNELKTSISNLGSSESGIVRLQNAIMTIQNTMKTTTTKYGSLVNQNDLKSTEAQLNNLKKLLSDLVNGKNINGKAISSAITDANKPLKEMAINARTASDALKLTQKDATTLGDAFKATASKLGIFFTSAMAMRQLWTLFKDGVNYVKQLDEAFFNISSTMNITKMEFQNITKETQNMAKELGLSASAVMDIVKTFANAQTTMADVMKMASPTAVLSNIGGLSTKETTKAVNTTLNAFRLLETGSGNLTTEINRISDVIIKVSQNMKYDFAKLNWRSI